MPLTRRDDAFGPESPAPSSLELEIRSHAPVRATSVARAAEPASRYGGGSVDFDEDPFAEGDAVGTLELDLPAPRPRPSVSVDHAATPSLEAAARSHEHAAATAPPALSEGSGVMPVSVPPEGRIQPATSAPPAPASASASRAGGASAEPARGAAMVANYPAAPSEVRHAPLYAAQVLLRQVELHRDLASLRRRRSPDVPLYEAALGAYDPPMFRLGIAMLVAIAVVAIMVLSLPLIVRGLAAG